MTPGQEGGGSFPPPLCFRRAAAKKEAAKQAWRPKSREETPKEGSNPKDQVAMHNLVIASHKIKGVCDFFFGVGFAA
jgi:hypothetical protein